MRFIGDYIAKTDAKGRVFLPAPFRKEIETAAEQRLILRADLFQPCLELYPESLWNQMLDMLSARLNRWNGKHQQLRRRFLADAEIVEFVYIGHEFLKAVNLVNNEYDRFMGTSKHIRNLHIIINKFIV